MAIAFSEIYSAIRDPGIINVNAPRCVEVQTFVQNPCGRMLGVVVMVMVMEAGVERWVRGEGVRRERWNCFCGARGRVPQKEFPPFTFE